jgi:DHA1 family bicyclomycin/chloramphenicol resistance-like MFS transporter
MLTTVVWISFCGTIVLLVLAFSGVHVLWAIVAPLVLVIGCQGFNNANAAAGALSRHAGHAGSASALMGTFQFGLGACSGVLVGLLTDGTPRGMAAMMFCGMLGAVIADRFRTRPEVIRP